MSTYGLNEGVAPEGSPPPDPPPPPVIKHSFPTGVKIAIALGLLVLAVLLISTPESAPRRTDLEKATHYCKYIKSKYARTPVGEIPLEDAERIVMCKQRGLW